MPDYSYYFGTCGLNDQVDVNSLLDDIGLDRREIEWRKDFISFDREDVERLSRYEPVFEEHAEGVAEMFYNNITTYAETTEVMGRSLKGIETLKKTQGAYLVTMAGGEDGSDYFRDRARIGKLHDIFDMPMKQSIGQYGVYNDLLAPIIIDRIQDQVSRGIDEATGSFALDGGVETGGSDADLSEAPDDRVTEGVEGMTLETGNRAVLTWRSTRKRSIEPYRTPSTRGSARPTPYSRSSTSTCRSSRTPKSTPTPRRSRTLSRSNKRSPPAGTRLPSRARSPANEPTKGWNAAKPSST